MADFAPARAGNPTGLTDGKVGEIIVEDEFLFTGAAGIRIELLSIFASAKGAESDGLSFTALKEGGPVRSREDRHLALNGADLVEAASIEALILIHDQAADRFLLDIVKCIFEDKLGYFFRGKFLNELLTDLGSQSGDGSLASEFAVGEQSVDDAVASEGLGFV